MEIEFSKQARKSYQNLPLRLKKKTDKQFQFLLDNPKHPSLRTKRMAGLPYFEGRIDFHYCFTFKIEGKTIRIMIIGPHDTGLGKK